MKTMLVLFFLLLNFMEAARSQSSLGCQSFTCGNFDFQFPFFTTDMPSRCGLFLVNCSDIPEIQLKENGAWYQLNSVSQAVEDNTISVTDPKLDQSLETGDCPDLSSFSLPNSPWLELVTLYKCNNTREDHSYEYCSNIYYTRLEDDLGCLAIQTPWSWSVAIIGNVRRLTVSATFSLPIKIPLDCPRCHNRGGECKMINDIYRCVGEETKEQSNHQEKIKLGVGLGGLAALIMIIIVVLAIIKRAKKVRKSDWNGKNVEEVVMLKRYSYTKVKKMTNSFAHVLGRGGFGIVYKGKLNDGGQDVAVKILKEEKGNGEEFINEVASMSRTSHVNIVSLLGFCYEENKRAIIYEFMPNGSLNEFISKNMSIKMDWERLYDIAVGVSRGLEYLHNRCVSRIVHFDIKPQNILMDKEFCPKISDFGLAKLWKNKESMISMLDARGTAGYIAPELFFKNFGVSHKSDVYSYGMVVLEMIGAKHIDKVENCESNNSSMYFPDWIYKDFERGDIMTIFGDQDLYINFF